MRAVYDKQGKHKVRVDSTSPFVSFISMRTQVEGPDGGFEDASAFFANVFGGERFVDWVRNPLLVFTHRLLLPNVTAGRALVNADRRDFFVEGDDECRRSDDDG
jgi:hypothetical protein